MPPLSFASFWKITFIMGFRFALVWGLIMWLFT
ncbi:DUF6404 family protein [Klebsiella aerogenes]